MKRFLKISTLLAAIAAVLFIGSCAPEESEDNADTLVEATDSAKIDKPEKTREELITNRDTMLPANPDSITDFEYKHTPDISFGEKDADGKTEINVKVGSNGIQHPSETEHWIDYISLYIDGEKIERKEMPNDGSAPQTSFKADLSEAKEVTVWAGCNIHGIWKNTKAVE